MVSTGLLEPIAKLIHAIVLKRGAPGCICDGLLEPAARKSQADQGVANRIGISYSPRFMTSNSEIPTGVQVSLHTRRYM